MTTLKKIYLSIAISATVSILLHVLRYYDLVGGNFVVDVSRWITLLLVVAMAGVRRSLTVWILVSMFVGIELGTSLPDFSKNLSVLSSIFLRMIKTVIAPLIFSTLVVGIAGHANLKQIGRIGIKSLVYFEIVTTLALFIGLFAINLTEIGKDSAIRELAANETATPPPPVQQEHHILLDVFPENIAKAVAEGHVLQVVVFSIAFGIALAMLSEQKRGPILRFTEGLSEVMFQFTNIVMYLAPLAVCGALAYAVSTFGFEVLKSLIALVGTLYVALIVFIGIVLVPIGFIIGLDFKKFFSAVSQPVAIAFSTASSEAALPKAMENLISAGLPKKIVSFVLPTGYSFNLDGSTLYLSMASVFVAQMAGVELTFGEQIKMVLILMLTSKGVAGVRGATFLILVATVADMGIDPAKAFVILGVDALMDMGRTSVNVIGNCLAAFVITRWEKNTEDRIETTVEQKRVPVAEQSISEA